MRDVPYFERQEAAMCSMHALSHAVGLPAFIASHLGAAAARVVGEALAAALEVGKESEERISNHTWPGGWYSEQVMFDARHFQADYVLDQVPLQAQPAGAGAIRQGDAVGTLVHLPGHWVAIRRVGSQLWLIDSCAQVRTRPSPLGHSR